MSINIIHNSKFTIQNCVKGFSLLEILVALVIVSILSVLAVNRYTSRTDEARISAAKAEVKAIADAERQCEIDTGYFVNLRALSFEPGQGGSPYQQGGIWYYKIVDYGNLNSFAIETDGSFIANISVFPYNNWNGPYMDYVNVSTTGTYNSGSPTSQLTYGVPLDPWGNPYHLFTPLQDTDPGTISETDYTGRFYQNAIVSYGKDGEPGIAGDPNAYPGEPNSDDIIYYF